MRILIGCEESGTVRDAFAALGHDAWSNDLIPARNGGQHLQMCVTKAITEYGPWDIIILHYDCTKTAVSGNRWYGKDMPRYQERLEDIDFAATLWGLAKKHARIGAVYENPVSVIWDHIGKPQYVQPWEYGHGETKKTGLLIDRLPALKPTNIVAGREQRVWKMPPGPNRKRDRSKTYQGIADAMAQQWGSNLESLTATKES